MVRRELSSEVVRLTKPSIQHQHHRCYTADNMADEEPHFILREEESPLSPGAQSRMREYLQQNVTTATEH